MAARARLTASRSHRVLFAVRESRNRACAWLKACGGPAAKAACQEVCAGSSCLHQLGADPPSVRSSSATRSQWRSASSFRAVRAGVRLPVVAADAWHSRPDSVRRAAESSLHAGGQQRPRHNAAGPAGLERVREAEFSHPGVCASIVDQELMRRGAARGGHSSRVMLNSSDTTAGVCRTVAGRPLPCEMWCPIGTVSARAPRCTLRT